METEISALISLQRLLITLANKAVDKKVFIGFDGFVDRIKKAVKEKQNTRTVYYDSIREFADRILVASGKSGQIQLATQRVKPGGNAPILSNALGALGVRSYCVGSMGYPALNPIFSGMHPLCESVSVLEPGLSDAIEFADGKLIFSELEVFEQYTWAHIKEVAGTGRISKAIGESAVVAFVDWANLPYASDIWYGVLRDIIKPSGRKDYMFLFDLCDPSKKTTQQIDEVLDLMSAFSLYGKVTLALNENETYKIWAALRGMDFIKDREKMPAIAEAGNCIYHSLRIDTLLIHPVDKSIIYHGHERLELQGRLVTRPKVLTGGGDNLNAGFCFGLLSDFTLPQCVLLGMAVAGAYIESGVSPDLQDVIEYLGVWTKELEQKVPGPETHIHSHRH